MRHGMHDELFNDVDNIVKYTKLVKKMKNKTQISIYLYKNNNMNYANNLKTHIIKATIL